MKPYGGFLLSPRELYSRMLVSVSIWMLLQMTSRLCLLILSSLTVSSQLGLEDVFFSPQDQTVTEGEEVFFQCVSGESSSSPASITWLKDGNVVAKGRQIQGEYGGGNQKKTSGTLHLFNVTLEDDGIYVCVTYNPSLSISKKSEPARLTVQGVPRRLKIIHGPDNITVAMGTGVSMHCAVRGFPVPMVHWFKDDCLLKNCSASFILQNNGQLLTFRNVTKDHEGFYHCEASNQRESIKSQPAFLLPAEMDWSFILQPTNMTVKRGENVTVTCRPPYSRPPAQVTWFRNNQQLSPTAHVTLLPSGDLFFNHVQEEDSGTYFCRASNIHLQRFLTSRRATLTVQAPPSVKLWPQVLTVPLGAQAVLQCQVSGHPLPSINFIKRGQSKQTGGKKAVGLRNATLHIQSAKTYDEGAYVCEASNKLGRSRSTAMLIVAVSPIIATFAGQVSYRHGMSAVLPCRAVGVLPITYTWTRGRAETNRPISATEDRHMDSDGSLHMTSVQWSDAGEYYCTAKNHAGRHQRRTVLTVTDDDHPIDRGKQTRLVLSASTSKKLLITPSSGSVAEQQANKTSHPHVQAKHKEAICSSSHCRATRKSFSRGTIAEQKMLPGSPDLLSRNSPNQPTTGPTQPLVTQMQPPMLPPPPHPNFHTVVLHAHLPVTRDPLSFSNSEPTITQSNTQYQLSETHLRVRRLQRQDKSSTGPSSGGLSTHPSALSSPLTDLFVEMSQLTTRLPVSESDVLTKVDSVIISNTTTNQSVTSSLQAELYPSASKNPQTELDQPGQKTHQQPSAMLTQISQSQSPFPKLHLELSTIQQHLPFTQTSTSSVAKLPESQIHGQPSPTLPTSSIALKIPPSLSATRLPVPNSKSSKLDLGIVNLSNQLNESQQGHPGQLAKSANDTELAEWLKRNTSQAPMSSNDPRVTQQSPSWLPILEKHDIPIVVGVGVSLAFIFITVTFYSVVQKNEPAPTSRAAQRNLGVPMRHAECRAAGRTYENRAFEDDECVAVIEQSPNISDTHARPPGPSLVTVQMEPTSENLQEDMQPALDNHTVTVETYPEPILDTKIDPSLEEEKSCSLPQPSIQLQCAEDWPSNGVDNHSPCQDPLPPPSSLPTCSPSPSPPPRREEGLRTSLTLQSPEPFAAPIQHSLSITHGNPPLRLSHHVSLGVNTVAVDVHFYPAVTASKVTGTSTQINSVSNSTSLAMPQFSPPLANSQENNQCK